MVIPILLCSLVRLTRWSSTWHRCWLQWPCNSQRTEKTPTTSIRPWQSDFFLILASLENDHANKIKRKQSLFFLTFILIMKFTTFLYWGVFSTHINTQSHLLFSSTQSKTIIRHASVNKIYLKEEKFTRPPAALTGLKKWKTVWKQWFTL